MRKPPTDVGGFRVGRLTRVNGAVRGWFSQLGRLAEIVGVHVCGQAVLVDDLRGTLDEREQVINGFLGDSLVVRENPLGGEVLHEVGYLGGVDSDVIDVVLVALAVLLAVWLVRKRTWWLSLLRKII